MMPPPRKSKTGLIVVVSIILLVVIAGGVITAIALTSKKTTSNTPGNPGNSPTATPTQGIPAGFTQFTGADFSIAYPSSWTKSGDSQGSGGQDFTGPTGQTFQISVDPHGSEGEIPVLLSTFCSILGNSKVTPTTVTIGGQQWQQADCGESSSLHTVIEAVFYKGKLFQISYGSLAQTFDNDKTQYFAVMEQSFAFLT